MNIADSVLLARSAYSLADQGLANTLVVESLRHGTDFINALWITIFGGDPSKGANPSGSTANSGINTSGDASTRGFFYLFKDSDFFEGSLLMSPLKCLLPRRHTILSSLNQAQNFFSNIRAYLPQDIISSFELGYTIIAAAITPTLKFHFTQIDPTRLENDNYYAGNLAAYKTKEIVEPWRLGLLGSIITGVNFDWFLRARANPLKVLTGVGQLIAAGVLTSLCYEKLKKIFT